MLSISNLLTQHSDQTDLGISSDGFAIWLAWEGEFNPVIKNTLQDYGGVAIQESDFQSLWFFFTSDALLALAKLVVWGKFNPIPMTVMAFPGKLLVDVEQNKTIELDKELAKQEATPPESGIEVLIHPDLQDIGANTPGFGFTPFTPKAGLAKLRWALLSADARLPYTSSQGWYAILRPIGNPLDKNFQNGWRNLFANLELILQEQKLKYSLADSFLMLPLDNLGQMRQWTKSLLLTLDETKERDAANYWPCVSAIVDKRGLNFNNELPFKVSIDWDTLMPDYPYMSYRNAYLLGNDFSIQALNYSTTANSMNSWCTVNLRELDSRNGTVPVYIASRLLNGNSHCFYCGARSHDSNRCPTKRMDPPPVDFWKRYSDLGLDEMNAGFRFIESKIGKSGTDSLKAVLHEYSPESRLLHGFFSIESDLQLRSVDRIWRLTGKDIDALPDERNQLDKSTAWGMIERLQRAPSSELGAIERELGAAMSQSPRDWRLHSLMGFVAVEQQDFPKALKFWRQAENMSSFVAQQGWHTFLQAHVLEMQGKYADAMDHYETAKRLLTQWQRPEYRKLICQVKTGMAERVKSEFTRLVSENPSLFNIMLLDVDLERGRKTILSALYPLWVDAQKSCLVEQREIETTIKESEAWFQTDSPLLQKYTDQLHKLLEEAKIKNYLTLFNVVVERPIVQEELAAYIQQEIQTLQKKYKAFLSYLEGIRDEASWFPFQRALVEFNRDFNEAAGILNWAFSSDFHSPEIFKKAQTNIEPITTLLKELSKRLRILRIMRDSTLFALILLKTFFWMEIVALVLAIITLVVILVFGGNLNMVWLQGMVKANFWNLQKVIISIITLASFGIAVLRTTLIFDRRKDKMLEEAREQREEMQQERLAKAQKKAEAMRNMKEPT